MRPVQKVTQTSTDSPCKPRIFPLTTVGALVSEYYSNVLPVGARGGLQVSCTNKEMPLKEPLFSEQTALWVTLEPCLHAALSDNVGQRMCRAGEEKRRIENSLYLSPVFHRRSLKWRLLAAGPSYPDRFCLQHQQPCRFPCSLSDGSPTLGSLFQARTMNYWYRKPLRYVTFFKVSQDTQRACTHTRTHLHTQPRIQRGIHSDLNV